MDFSNDDKPNYKKLILDKIIEKSSKCSEIIIDKVGSFIQSILSQNTEQLKEISRKGLPDDIPILRSLIWKINLGYLPIDTEKWDEVLSNQRKSYKYYKDFFTKSLQEEVLLFNEYNKKTKEEKQELDSKTNKKLLEDIKKDVNRTHMQLSFFFQPLDKSKHLSKEEMKDLFEERQNCSLKDINKIYQITQFETHADVLARILYIYAKFMPDVTYNQGMNEIIAPIYYCYSFDKFLDNDMDNYANIEADTFWSFCLLMNKLKYVYISEEDENDRGKKGITYKFSQMIKIIDEDIYNTLTEQEVDFSFFVPRWFILLFSQDFLIVDILRLWDFLFSDENTFKNVYFAALAVILIKKDKLINQDMAGILNELRNFEGIFVDTIITNANIIEESYGDVLVQIINEKNI